MKDPGSDPLSADSTHDAAGALPYQDAGEAVVKLMAQAIQS
ncbi:hypothetical protein GCM10011348_30910 [Marinobacterium nitratireducens]|uniref:Uncharacterized protein n=1 Tax=Marinobacterium nitratireducens TaxID=518897 RepID=A0A918DWA2_9GAMM|nr:hypothetical protein [Marinobacterium nitratireducens]GGO84502.1 hypothetical protein GCM10011348_30910 [Marinobacterium nitratireducens]